MIGVIGRVGEEILTRQAGDQPFGLRALGFVKISARLLTVRTTF